MSKQINFIIEDSIYEDTRLAAFQKRQSVAAYVRDRVLKQAPMPFAPVSGGQVLAPMTQTEFLAIVTNPETGKISLELILKFLREKGFLAPE